MAGVSKKVSRLSGWTRGDRAGHDDAAALTYGGIAIAMVEHDRELAQRDFEAALAISPSASWAFGGSMYDIGTREEYPNG
jgi:hypothetical protein